MSDVAYLRFTCAPAHVQKWQTVFKAAEKSGFSAKFEIALEALSTQAAEMFEVLLEESDGELGNMESWSHEDNQFEIECELVGCDPEELIEVLTIAGAKDITFDEPY